MLLNGEQIDFVEISEVVLENVTVADTGNNSVAAQFSNGVKMEIEVQNGFISVMLITLPDNLKEKTRGLMGVFNGDPTDDLLAKPDKEPISSNSSIKEIHNYFGMSCMWHLERVYTSILNQIH